MSARERKKFVNGSEVGKKEKTSEYNRRRRYLRLFRVIRLREDEGVSGVSSSDPSMQSRSMYFRKNIQSIFVESVPSHKKWTIRRSRNILYRMP